MDARLTLAHDQRRNCTVIIVVVVVMVGSSRIETKAAMVAVKVRTNIYICVCTLGCILVRGYVVHLDVFKSGNTCVGGLCVI